MKHYKDDNVNSGKMFYFKKIKNFILFIQLNIIRLLSKFKSNNNSKKRKKSYEIQLDK